MLASFRRARVAAATGVVGLLLGVGVPAHADTAGAEAHARAILAKVQALQARVKHAEQAYDRSLAGVASSVNAAIQTGSASDQVAAQAAAATDAFNKRVRDLYMSGGPLAIYATMLESGDVTQLQSRIVLADHVVAADSDLVQADDAVAAQVASQAAQASRTATRQVRTERTVAGAASRVLALLNEQQQLLAKAQATVSHLQAVDAARAAYAAQSAAFTTITDARLAQLHVLPPSSAYMSLYHRAAATCPGLSWTVLASIGQVESGHGRNPSMSSAGALGPMQFLPSTFQKYAVDGDKNGVADIMDPADAIFTAASYLCANGAGGGGDALYSAIWHYNHADWYVQMVLTLSQQYAAQFV